MKLKKKEDRIDLEMFLLQISYRENHSSGIVYKYIHINEGTKLCDELTESFLLLE